MIYLDHAATTSIRPPVYEALNYWYSSGKCGNPSSLHSAGRQAHQAIYQARFDVSKLIGADSPEEIIFTSGGSESDNLALTGMASALNATNHNVMLVSQIEHHAILNQCNLLTRLGIKDDLFYVKNDGDNVKLTWISAGLIKTYSVPSNGSKDDIVEDSVATSSAVIADMIGSF